MRVFSDLNEAVMELNRDLAKSPSYVSSRVQNSDDGRLMHEAAPYLYSVALNAVPTEIHELVDLARRHFPYWQEQDRATMKQWLSAELDSRVWASEGIMSYADDQHPTLCQAFEGQHPSYSYNERLLGWRELILRSLVQEGSRRAFWPIFHPTDAVRAPLKTRIPCTIGYQWIMRPVLGDGAYILDATLMQRSCDFQRFWISDLWLTAELTRILLAELQSQEVDVVGGVVNHFIGSFHAFIEGEVF